VADDDPLAREAGPSVRDLVARDPDASAFAAHSGAAFSEPWVRRVRDVDDHTLAGLLRTLVSLRRLKFAVAIAGCLLGALVFGGMNAPNPIYALLIYGTLAGAVGMPIFAISSLSVRRLFLKEGARHGLTRSASMLILTRAERRARLLAPWKSADDKIELLLKAVREPDTA
jgi:hypothetical protein